MPVLPRLNNYDDIYRQFRWNVPARYNIGVDVCDHWAQAEPNRLAILHVRPDGGEDAISYGALRETSNRLANVLRAHGVARGDRVAILLPQAPEVAAAHIAIYKLGAVALPLAVLFGIDALRYRLQNSGATALIANAQGVGHIAEIRKDLPDLKLLLSLDGAGDGALDFAAVLARRFEKFDPEEAFALMARAQIRNAFIPPTALRMLRAARNPQGRHAIKLRSIGSVGETLGAETYEWGKQAFGLTINEFYGQTECNLVLSACGALGMSRPGAIGKPVAGHTVAVIGRDIPR